MSNRVLPLAIKLASTLAASPIRVGRVSMHTLMLGHMTSPKTPGSRLIPNCCCRLYTCNRAAPGRV